MMEGLVHHIDPDGYAIVFPYFLWPFLNIGSTASIFLILAIALERLYALRYPHDFKKNEDPMRVVKLVSRVVAPALALNASKFFELRPQGEIMAETQLGCNIRALFRGEQKIMPTEMYKSEGYQIYDATILALLITGVLPFAALTCMYAKIYQDIAKIRSNPSPESRSERKMKREADFAEVFAGFVIAFLVCHTPRVLERLLSQPFFGEQDGDMTEPIPVWVKITTTTFIPLLTAINSAANLPIYAGRSKQFRNECKAFVRKLRAGDSTRPSRGTYSLTLASRSSQRELRQSQEDTKV